MVSDEIKQQEEAKKQKLMFKIQWAHDLEELYDNPTFQKVLAGMMESKYACLKVIDDPTSTPDQVKDAIYKRQMVGLMIESFRDNMLEGKRAQEEMTKQLEWEKERDQGKGEVKPK